MGLPPWETSDSQLFTLITGANSGLGYSIAARLIDEFITSPSTPENKYLVLILCTRSPIKTRFTISRLRAHLRKLADYSEYATKQREKAKAQGTEYKWGNVVQRVHFLGVEVDLCDLKSVYAVADQLVNGTVGSPDATTIDGFKLPHGSPGTASYSKDIKQDSWALSQKEGSDGVQRSWGWGLSGIRLPRLDAVILCAGAGGWLGVDWMAAIPAVLTNLVEAVTWPTYKLPDVGTLVKSQTTAKTMKASDEGSQPLLSEQEKSNEPPLGAVFCSNVFGHYVLAHELMPLLSRPASRSCETGGKIIWTSSIEALSGMFDIDDIQGLKSQTPYESSKRLIDLLAITSELRSVRRVAAPFFDSSNIVSGAKAKKENGKSKLVKPKVYLTHPGIFVSDILPLNWFLVFIYRCIFYFVRWIGSPWHTITAEKAAVAPVWMTLTEPEVLEEMEGHGAAKVKWGSATDASGEERVMKTEVPGWGWEGKLGGQLEGERRKGRRKDAVELTPEAREEFEILGAKCWAEMEVLRKEWEVILGVKERKK